jgi:hypothetical protein
MITMRRIVRAVPIVALATVAVTVTASAAQPPASVLPSDAGRPLGAPILVEAVIPIQGRLTDAAGHPVADGDYDLTFRLRDGTPTPLCTDAPPPQVHVEDGLFNATISGCPTSIFDGRYMCATVEVGSDGEMSPCLSVNPVPYAMSLRPGATINNRDAGRGLTVKSGQMGGTGAALWAENTNGTAGIGLWAVAAGGDATVISSNTSLTGALFKGFGGDGGEDEFRVQNDGAIETKADSYVFVPGVDMRQTGGVPGSISINEYGVAVFNPGAMGVATVAFAVSLPAVLYGQPVELEDLTIYCDSFGDAEITQVDVTVLQANGGATTVLTSTEDQACATYAGFALTAPENTLLSADAGILGIAIDISTFDVTSMKIGGLRLHLGHHDLY